MNITAIDNPAETPTIEEVKNIIGNILKISSDEWPNDKEVEIDISFKVVPENLKIKITKK